MDSHSALMSGPLLIALKVKRLFFPREMRRYLACNFVQLREEHIESTCDGKNGQK